MGIYPVSERKVEELQSKMLKLGLKESDFEESFIRSGGSGGQNVNKVSTCVVLRHRPTGLEVRCQRERSQGLNRYLAKRLLVEKIEERILGEASQRRHQFEKIRRQKRKRSRRAKEKMLESKRHRSEKKRQRGRFRGED
ncbi:MAG TPA: peptide chain release factor-like protein [Candidatus Omnitrophota bacterium]|nr:peptide chain release factor-like protein [Candidatus Omnitrophota bacterium]